MTSQTIKTLKFFIIYLNESLILLQVQLICLIFIFFMLPLCSDYNMMRIYVNTTFLSIRNLIYLT